MKLLVVIVTYNAMQWAERCFDSLRKSTINPDVFVVDNGSTDGTQTYIQEHYPEVMFQQSNENLGFGKANNIGLQYALDNEYDYVYLLNQDAWVMSDTFEKLIEISQKYPEYGILSPFQTNADLYHIDSKFETRIHISVPRTEMLSDFYSQKIESVYPVSGVMAPHWLLTKRCLEEVGGFSPSFPHYSEDYNYVDRLFYWGLKIGVVPKLRVVHDRGWREDTVKQKIYLVKVGYIQFLSNPNMSLLSSFCQVCLSSVNISFKYHTIRPVINTIKILLKYNMILKNRKISMSKRCAFLNWKN